MTRLVFVIVLCCIFNHVIPFRGNNAVFERVKAWGFNRSQVDPSSHINMDPLVIVESQELSSSSNTALFPRNGIESEKDLISLSRKAEAFVSAQEYIEASYLYEKILHQSTLNWQKARALYNLGTTRLMQSQPLEALQIFRTIVPVDLSMPSFERDLLLNIGIAYLQQAESAAPFGLEIFLTQQALQVFKQVQKRDCQEQKAEKIDNAICPIFSLANPWIKQAQLKLHAFYQQKRENWMQQASIEELASLINFQLKQLLDYLTIIPEQEHSSYLSYFQNQAESLFPLWNHLQQKQFSLSQKEIFDQVLQQYLDTLNHFTTIQVRSDLKKITSSLEALTFKTEIELRKAFLSYQLLLFQESFSLMDFENIISQFNSLKGFPEEKEQLEEIKQILQQSLDYFKNYQWIEAHFLLLTGFSYVENLISTIHKTPLNILKNGLEQALRTLQLSFLWKLLTNKAEKNSFLIILQKQQKEILRRAKPFIESVLEEQKIQIEEHKHSSCQKNLWEQVIPLFDHGYQLAQSALADLQKPSSLNFDSLIAKQQQTIQDWQQGQAWLINPPINTFTPSLTPSEDPRETLRLIQEMYQEDQSQPMQEIQELDTW